MTRLIQPTSVAAHHQLVGCVQALYVADRSDSRTYVNDEQVATRTVIGRGDAEIEVVEAGAVRASSCSLRLRPRRVRWISTEIAEWLAAPADSGCCAQSCARIGRSRGPMTGIDLHDYAADVAAVIAHGRRRRGIRGQSCLRQPGVAHVGGTDRSTWCAQLAAHQPPTSAMRQARRSCARPSRRKRRSVASLTPGASKRPAVRVLRARPTTRRWSNGSRARHRCWRRYSGSPATDLAGRGLRRRPSADPLFAAGLRPLAHVARRPHEFEAGAQRPRHRRSYVAIASHAAVAEQPDAISDALIDYAKTLARPGR